MPMPTILLVDDDEDFRSMFADLLRLDDLRVVEAESGERAIAVLERATRGRAPKPSLLVLDLIMPVMSGIELLQRLRRWSRWSKLPALVVTAVNDSMLPVRLNVPVAFKPDVEILRRAVRQLLEGALIPGVVAIP